MNIEIVLPGKRIVLRDFIESDLEQLHEFSSDPLVVRHASWGPNTKEETAQFLAYTIASQSARPRTNYDFAMVLIEQGRLIGSCGVRVSDFDDKSWQIGIYLNRKFWGQGYGTEAVSLILDFALNQLQVERVVALTSPENYPSHHVFNKAGMILVQRLYNNKYYKGTWHDSLLFESRGV